MPSRYAPDILIFVLKMEFLISFYDNALIYYPNLFFAVLFFIGILGIILVSIGIIIFGKKIGRVMEEIKSSLKQIKRIKRNERKKIPFAQIIRVFFERKKISFVCIIRYLTISFVHMIKVNFIRINTALGRIESQTEKIIKKIGKEILIDE